MFDVLQTYLFLNSFVLLINNLTERLSANSLFSSLLHDLRDHIIEELVKTSTRDIYVCIYVQT